MSLLLVLFLAEPKPLFPVLARDEQPQDCHSGTRSPALFQFGCANITGNVGKTQTVLRYVKSTFIAEYDPLADDIYSKQEIVDGNPVILGTCIFFFA